MSKNIIFVLLDGARCDRLDESSDFRKLKKLGCLFDNIIAAYPYTFPAINSMFTGLFGKENGVDATRWEVQRHFKVAFAFTNLIVVLFGIPLVVMRPKSGLAFGGGISFLVIFSYYAFIKFGQSLGINGVMDPLTSAWLGNVVFIIGGLLLLFSVRK